MCSSSAGKIKLFWPSLIPFGLALASVIVLFSQNFVLVHGAKECFDWNMLMANLGTICAIIIIVIVGIICIFQAIFFAIRQIYDMRLPWLGVLLFFVALWAYCASSLTVLFCLGEETIQVLEYVSLMTIPLPILYFTWHTSNCRYHLLLVFGSLTYGNIFLQCAMASAGAIGIDDYRPVTHVLFVADLVVCIYCLARHSKKSSHPQNNFMLTFGFASVSVFGLASMFFYWQGKQKLHLAVALAGLVIFAVFMESVIIFSYIDSLQRNRSRVQELRTIEALSAAKGRMLEQLVDCIISAMEAKDSYTADHSNRVKELAVLIAEKANYSNADLEDIRKAANLHDIGKLGIPDRILLKPAKLTDHERKVMCEHAALGSQIISQVDGMYRISRIILHHHERYDGKGYPEGISGESIPIGARVIAIADSIDAMTSDRCYRKALGLERCRSEIEKNMGVMYDPVLARITLDNWDEVSGIVSAPTKRRSSLFWLAEVMQSFQS